MRARSLRSEPLGITPQAQSASSIFFDAALRNLDWWVRFGIAPPHADPILVSASSPAPVLDEFGNVQGGLRSPYLDLPASTWFGSSTGPSFCSIAGHKVPFSEAQLARLYRNHGDYVSKVTRDTASLVAERFLTVPDGLRLIQEAARANVP